MLMPVRVVATLTLAQTRFVPASASGMAAIRLSSLWLDPLWTRAEKPPMKSTPTWAAAASRAFA